MLKQLRYLMICLFFVSCTKTIDDVHFHGKITLDCNNQLPAKNVTVTIYRYFDRGLHDAVLIGKTTTDNNGNYFMITDVEQKGKFEYYGLNVFAPGTIIYPEYFCYAQTNVNSTNIEMNCQAKPLKVFGFHIKNASPFNTFDVFNSLIIFRESTFYVDTVLHNIFGTNVDTTLYLSRQSPLKFKYSFTKNSILTSTPDTTISNWGCLDTLIVNLRY